MTDLKKNDIIEGVVCGYTSEGAGVLKKDGYPLFVNGAAKGDVLRVRVLKALKSYGYARIEKIMTPSADRKEAECACAGACGGCSLMHINYAAQLEFKRQRVRDAFLRIAGTELPVCAVVPSPKIFGYRNKVSVPVKKENGKIKAGFFAPCSHRIAGDLNCILQTDIQKRLISAVLEYMEESGTEPYDEEKNSGAVRHIYIREGMKSGEIMVSLVSKKASLKNEELLVKKLLAVSDKIKSIIININPNKTNVILGRKNRTLYGTDSITDELCGLKFKIHHNSFYQVNHGVCELLYSKAAELISDAAGKSVLDVYCGIGTIGLCAARGAKNLTGIEFVEQAVKNAMENARLNGAENARCFAGDAQKVMAELCRAGEKYDTVILDPPRKGCGEGLLSAAASCCESILYISCNPETLARDVKYLSQAGFYAKEAYPFDMFPNTAHVETVVLLCRKTPDDVIKVKLSLDELELTSAESKATYEKIKEYVMRNFGLKVSTLYIAQTKRKLGIAMGENYNMPKSIESTQPQCPPDKEVAIVKALEHFKMI